MEKSTMFRCSVFYELGMECETSEERAELWQAIMEYGLYDKEPPQKFKRDFVNVRFILDKSKWISERRSKAWQNHSGNQYTKGDSKRKAQKDNVEQNGTNGTNQNSNSISYSTSSKEERNRKKEEMLEAFRNDTRLTPYMDEEDVKRWLDYKEKIKKPYQDTKSFITAMVKAKNNIAKGNPKSAHNRMNRFSFLVDTAIGSRWEWLKWYDSMEQEYLDSKDDLYPTPKQNE